MSEPTVVPAQRREFFAAFADLMYRQKNVTAAFNTFVASGYVQHNPGLADGRDAACDALAVMFADPGFSPEIVRMIVDDDLCALHLRIWRDGQPVAAVVDVYRADSDRIVEHWDVIQPWPETSANDHPMF